MKFIHVLCDGSSFFSTVWMNHILLQYDGHLGLLLPLVVMLPWTFLNILLAREKIGLPLCVQPGMVLLGHGVGLFIGTAGHLFKRVVIGSHSHRWQKRASAAHDDTWSCLRLFSWKNKDNNSTHHPEPFRTPHENIHKTPSGHSTRSVDGRCFFPLCFASSHR